MKDPRDVIIAPILSEKSYGLIEQGVYSFRVHPTATKPEIKDAIEQIFNVRVIKVNTLNRQGKRVRNRRNFTYGQRRNTKRAMVKLHDDDSIQMFDL